MINRILSSTGYRVKMARFGIFYISSFELRTVRVAGRRVRLKFPDSEVAEQRHELGRLLFDDCYYLSEVKHPVTTVLDIGANTGCFALAARHHFPQARIHCYEPNRNLEASLAAHCTPIGAEYFFAGVGAQSGRLNLNLGGSLSMHTICEAHPKGNVELVGFREAVAKLGTVDLLKLDCEGAEWDLFSVPEAWSRIRSVTMEYHLWARPNSTAGDVLNQLNRLGFQRIVVEPSDKGSWGFARAWKTIH